MINREIIYERDIHKSYMKIPSVMETCFDEKVLFQKTYTGCIPMEKCFVNGQGQYWYDISGKQALDDYCRVHQLHLSFFQTIILRICNQLEILEWNLIDAGCLMLDPELIFVNNREEDILFLLYPNDKGDFFQDFQQLMEYLLTKLNHEEEAAVHAAYKIYEMTLTDGYSMSDIKEAILNSKVKKVRPEKRASIPIFHRETDVVSQKKESPKEECKKEEQEPVPKGKEWFYQKWKVFQESLLRFLTSKPADFRKKKEKQENPIVVYPEEEIVEQMEIHPTICLAVPSGDVRGIFMYEGGGEYKDIHLPKQRCLIGKGNRVQIQIERETISQFHAKVEYMNENYYIEDLNSTNGTFLNDEILNYKEQKLLHAGDSVRFADVKYRFL